MFSVAGINLIPTPDFSVEPEYFYAGSEIIGGIFKITLSGTYYASSVSDYSEKENSLISLIGGCTSLTPVGDCGSFNFLGGAVGYVEGVDINPGDVLTFQYSISLSIPKDGTRQPVIGRSSNLDFADIPPDEIVSKYSFEESSSMSPLQKFSVGSSGEFTNVAGTISVNAEIGFYNANRCDSSGKDSMTSAAAWLQSRTYSKIKIPPSYSAVLMLEEFGVSKSGGSVKKEYYVVPNGANAIVTVTSSDQTMQIMGNRRTTLSGTIEGIRSYADAESVYAKIASYEESSIKRLMSNTCGDIKTLPVDLCYILLSSKKTENRAKKSISFELTYGEVERCLTAGYRILTEYTETEPVKKATEHIVPGKKEPIVFVSSGKTAERKTLKVSSKFTSCNEDFINTVKGGVTKEFNFQKNALGLNGNYIRLSRSEDEGRYSYSIQEEFIKCE